MKIFTAAMVLASAATGVAGRKFLMKVDMISLSSGYTGYTPTAKATYECVDDRGKTTGKWQAPEDGALHCTGIPCPSAAPQDSPGESGESVAHCTTCAAAVAYDRVNLVDCDHGNGVDEPCKAGYNYNDHVHGTKEWDECESTYGRNSATACHVTNSM